MRKRGERREKPPRKVIVKKASLFKTFNSPTESPIKKGKELGWDIYDVEQDEDFTVFRADLPSLRVGAKVDGIGNQLVISTEVTEYQTPTITFIPKRPKRFLPGIL